MTDQPTQPRTTHEPTATLRELEQRYREHARTSVHPDFRAAYAAVANDLSRMADEAPATEPEDGEGDELVCVDMCGSCDACGMEPFGTPAEGWREAARFLRRTARASGDRAGALHGARLIEAELRRMADEAQQQPECTASISGNCLREAQSETACDTDDGECVHGGRPAAPAPAPDAGLREQHADAGTAQLAEARADIARVRAECDRLRRASVLADGEPHTDREHGVIQAITRILAALDQQQEAVKPHGETRKPFAHPANGLDTQEASDA